MDIFYNSLFPSGLHFQRTIYSIFLAVVSLILFLNPCFGQEIGAYKTRASGDFNQTSTWDVWDGSNWTNANRLPGATTDIYVDRAHTLRLTAPEAVKNLFLFSGAGAGQKLNLNGFNLDVYGVLAGFSGTVPGLPRGAWNSQNWIGNSPSSTLTFKGQSRVIVEKTSWSAQTTQSRFGVIFDPGPDQELTLLAPFKALFFRIRSGALSQKNDTTISALPCFTLSFNTESAQYGSGPFGTVTVEAGATYRSECNAHLINRNASGNNPALLFDLQRDATLLLLGQTPRIEAATCILEGTLIFNPRQGPGTFLSSSFPLSSKPIQLRHLTLKGEQDLMLPTQLILRGNMVKEGQGQFQLASTHLQLSGAENQELRSRNLLLESLSLTKSSGVVTVHSDLSLIKNLTMEDGSIDFQGFNLTLNTSQTGAYNYQGGGWKRLGHLTYFGLPATLTASSSTFPFEDLANGGQRWIQLLGSPPAAGELRIEFVEEKGANHDVNFQDVDGTTILYQLNSHFKISVGPVLAEVELELRMAADSLLIEQLEDLRLVKRGRSGPGIPLQGVAENFPWARRRIKWADLPGHEWTIGSFREATVLPLRINVNPRPREPSPIQNTDVNPKQYWKFKGLPINILNCLPRDFRRFP
jgi:hypothetical protein